MATKDICMAKIWPETYRSFIRQKPNLPIGVIILAKSGQMAQAAEHISKFARFNDFGGSGASSLGIINGYAATATGDKALSIATSDAIEAIWYIHPRAYEIYVRMIKSFDDIVKQPVSVINVSLGMEPNLMPWPYRPNEPIHRATKAVADNNQLIVFAAGNGGPKDDSLNPWSLAPWVISVGACSQDGRTLAPFSARGRPGEAIYRPTVVAPGMDIEVVFTPEEMPTLKKAIKYHPTGTSYAAPMVTALAQNIVFFLDELKKDAIKDWKSKNDKHRTFSLAYEYDKGEIKDDRIIKNRLIGSLDIQKGRRVGTYPLLPSPYLIKQIIMDMAIGVPGYEPHEVGAGFIDLERVQPIFDRIGKTQGFAIQDYNVSK